MILYKYYNAENGLKAIESRRLGFRSPEYFNDPFELTALSNGDGPDSKRDMLRQQVQQLKEHVVILSLTRNPMNPLMWAHYGCDHTGVVVGYDVSGAFLTSQEHNLIPVDSGDVIYTHTKSPFKMTPETMAALLRTYQWSLGLGERPSYKQQAIARRLFLTKHASWVYEEEVRVVKMTFSYSEEVAVYQSDSLRTLEVDDTLPDGLHRYSHQVPVRAIYLGARNTTLSDSAKRMKLETAGCPVFKLQVDDASWQLTDEQVQCL